uniref:Cytochrome P450 n=1 Tax=Talaromyces marneffei PM1 TaxID=1077442 RepID=A0A093XYC9_TALMA
MVWPSIAIAIPLFLLLIHFSSKSERSNATIHVQPSGVLGLTTLSSILRHLKSNRFTEWIIDVLSVPGHTAEMNIFGTRFILTEEPENLKAIFTNQIAGIKESDIQITGKHVQELLDRISSSQSTDGLDVYDALDRLQLNIALHRFLGQDKVTDVAAYEKFRKAKHILGLAGTLHLFLGPIGGVVGWFMSRKAKIDVNEYITGLIDFANCSEDSAGKEALQTTPTRDFLLALLLAGKDPTVIGVSWTIYQLAQHPQIYARLRSEIESHIGFEKAPDLASLEKMPFLKMVIQETMRLTPPIGFNFREALQDTTLPRGGGGHGQDPIVVKKGHIVFASIFGMHRLPTSVGIDADSWRPDRWKEWTPPEGEFIPFSTGPRNCLGRSFAQFQMEYIVVRILQKFSGISYEGLEQQVKFEINTKPAFPVLCKFHTD